MPIKDVSVHYYNWGPFVMKTKLPNDVINDLKSKGRTAKIYWNKNLAGHLKKQIRYDQPDAEWFYEEVGPVFATYKELADKYHGWSSSHQNLKFHSLWVNFMTAGEFNPPHRHTGDLSFVIFCQTPEKLKEEREEYTGRGIKPGNLFFQYNTNYTGEGEKPWETNSYEFEPEVGDMYIFPAKLQHMVVPFTSEGTRISVSGNISFLSQDTVMIK